MLPERPPPCRREKVELRPETSIQSAVGIGPNGAGGFGRAVELVVDIPDIERATAEKLVAAAHQICPYSNAMRGNVDVNVSVARLSQNGPQGTGPFSTAVAFSKQVIGVD